jgi:hypothetical protein
VVRAYASSWDPIGKYEVTLLGPLQERTIHMRIFSP